MKLGISGAQSTGKTTLLNALRSETFFKDFSVCNEVTRKVASYGIPINEQGNSVTQELIMNQHIVNLVMHDKMITDRTSLDGFIYTTYLHEKGQVDHQTWQYAKEVMKKTLPMYDILFYIAPEFDIVADGVRSVDIEFRKDIVDLFDEYIYTKNLNVIKLTGSVRDRIQQVMEAVNAR